MNKPSSRPSEDDKFVVFTPANCASPPKTKKLFLGQASITFRRNGAIGFTKVLYGLLHDTYMKNPDRKDPLLKLNFVQSKENVQDWYISVVADNGWNLKEYGTRYKTYSIMSAKLCDIMREALSIPETTTGFVMLVTRKPVEETDSPYFGYFPILTKSMKMITYKSRKKDA
jgi:hypothetical protein